MAKAKTYSKKQYGLVSGVERASEELEEAIEAFENARDKFDTALVKAERGGVKLVLKSRRLKLHKKTASEILNLVGDAQEKVEEIVNA